MGWAGAFPGFRNRSRIFDFALASHFASQPISGWRTAPPENTLGAGGFTTGGIEGALAGTVASDAAALLAAKGLRLDPNLGNNL